MTAQADGVLVVTPAAEPAASGYVEQANLGEMALEAIDRAMVASLTATKLGEVLAALGLPVLPDKRPGVQHPRPYAARPTAARVEQLVRKLRGRRGIERGLSRAHWRRRRQCAAHQYVRVADE